MSVYTMFWDKLVPEVLICLPSRMAGMELRWSPDNHNHQPRTCRPALVTPWMRASLVREVAGKVVAPSR